MKTTETKSLVLLHHHLKALRLPTVAAECEKVAAVAAADNADHLAYLADIRESIHLRALGRQNPLDEFHRMAVDAFASLAARPHRAAASALAADSALSRAAERGAQIAQEKTVDPYHPGLDMRRHAERAFEVAGP